MRNCSKMEIGGEFDPIYLDPEFPVTDPSINLRTDAPPVAPHVHDCFELGYCYEGSGIFQVENKILAYESCDAIAVNHRELHLAVSASGTVSRWHFLNLDPALLLAGHVFLERDNFNLDSLSGPGFMNVIKSAMHPDICLNIKEIIRETKEKYSGYQDVVRAQVWSLLAKLRRIQPPETGACDDDGISRKGLERVRSALKYVAENFSKPVSVKKLAHICHLSVPQFRRVFCSALGCPPSEYLIHFRMKIATALLRDSRRSILEISLESGYPTLSNFNRHFKSLYGLSPREWRKARKAD